MSPRFHLVLDSVISLVIAATTAASTSLLSTEDATGQVSELRVFLIPLLGAVIAMGGAIMLNPVVETRRIIIGRALIGLIFGTATPSVLVEIFPSLRSLAYVPAALFLGGAVIATVFYVLSRPFFAHLYRRSDSIAAAGMDAIEKQVGEKIGK